MYFLSILCISLSMRLYFVQLLWPEHFPSSFQPQDLWMLGSLYPSFFWELEKALPLLFVQHFHYFNHMQQFSIYLCSCLEQVSGAYIVTRNDMIEVIIGKMMWNVRLSVSCSVHSTWMQWRNFPLIPGASKNHRAETWLLLWKVFTVFKAWTLSLVLFYFIFPLPWVIYTWNNHMVSRQDHFWHVNSWLPSSLMKVSCKFCAFLLYRR